MYLDQGSLHSKNVTSHRKPPLKPDIHRGLSHPTMSSYRSHKPAHPPQPVWAPCQEYRPAGHSLLAHTHRGPPGLSTQGNVTHINSLQFNPSTTAGRKWNLLFPVLQTSCPSSAGGSIPVLVPQVVFSFFLYEQLFGLIGCCRPRNQPQMVRQFHFPTSSSAAVVLGHKYLGADPQTEN